MTALEQAEQALFGCLLEDSALSSEIMADWFDDKRIAHLVGISDRLVSAGSPLDISTVIQAAGNSDLLPLLLDCQSQCHSAANFAYWRDIVTDHAARARLAAAAQEFILRLPEANGDLRGHISRLETALAAPIKNERRTLMPKEIALGLSEHLEGRFNLQGRRSGLVTGFSQLDRLLDGLQFGEFTILGARPGTGKTALACNIVERVCLRDKIPTLFLSLEMSAAALSRRLLASHQSIGIFELKSGRLSAADFVKISAFDSLLKKSSLFIREAFGGMTAGEAASLIRRGTARHGVKLVVIDYLQKFKADHAHEKRTYEIAESSSTLVDAVKQSGVACLCLAQLNRESEKDKGRAPRLNDLADSGKIEQDADTVLLLNRNREEEPHRAVLIVAKQRDGETGIVRLHFTGEFCRFNDELPDAPDGGKPPHND